MNQSELLREILEDTAKLLREGGKTVTVPPEVAAFLDRLEPPETRRADAPAPQAASARADTPPEAPCVQKAPAPSAPPAYSSTPAAEIPEDLPAMAEAVSRCEKCRLHTTRRNTVFGAGDPEAELVFVGEGPGEEEDKQGEPFVGRAGELLTDIISAMTLTREQVYICNIVKCRPPGNRNPVPEEMAACLPWLEAQLDRIQPRVICALGGVAAKALLDTDQGVGRLRGQWHTWRGIPLRVTYHPSYLLRCQGEKQRTEKGKVWADVQEVMKLLGKEKA
jgi:uracil-DNA glycosylase